MYQRCYIFDVRKNCVVYIIQCKEILFVKLYQYNTWMGTELTNKPIICAGDLHYVHRVITCICVMSVILLIMNDLTLFRITFQYGFTVLHIYFHYLKSLIIHNVLIFLILLHFCGLTTKEDQCSASNNLKHDKLREKTFVRS